MTAGLRATNNGEKYTCKVGARRPGAGQSISGKTKKTSFVNQDERTGSR